MRPGLPSLVPDVPGSGSGKPQKLEDRVSAGAGPLGTYMGTHTSRNCCQGQASAEVG